MVIVGILFRTWMFPVGMGTSPGQKGTKIPVGMGYGAGITKIPVGKGLA